LSSALTPSPTRASLFPYTTLFRSYTKRFNRVHRLEVLGAMTLQSRRNTQDGFAANQVPNEELGIYALAQGLPLENYIGASRSTLDRKSTRLNSSHVKISYAVFCLK